MPTRAESRQAQRDIARNVNATRGNTGNNGSFVSGSTQVTATKKASPSATSATKTNEVQQQPKATAPSTTTQTVGGNATQMPSVAVTDVQPSSTVDTERRRQADADRAASEAEKGNKAAKARDNKKASGLEVTPKKEPATPAPKESPKKRRTKRRGGANANALGNVLGKALAEYNKPVETVDENVAGSEEVQTERPDEISTGYVDLETGEIKKTKSAKKAPKGVRPEKSKMTEVMEKLVSGEMQQPEVKPAQPAKPAKPAQVVPEVASESVSPSQEEGLSPTEQEDAYTEYLREISGDERYNEYLDAQDAYERALEAEADTVAGEEAEAQEGPFVPPEDGMPDHAGKSGRAEEDERNLDRIYEYQRVKNGMSQTEALNYLLSKERKEHGLKRDNKYSHDKQMEDKDAYFDFEEDESEGHLARRLREMQRRMIERFRNPALVRIAGEYVEMKKERVNGRTVTYARLRYSERVEGAIGRVRRTYGGCSWYNVMQLVQLRAGLGIDKHGRIAKVDPNEFRLTEDQFVELCRDICESQRVNGHPLGSVEGRPGANGVRDDTGRYVVVAKTRCFPIGYLPMQLMMDLSESPASALYDLHPATIQNAIKREWLDVTYPTLCANTGGNLMFQARAIENMMRAITSIDGRLASDYDIPDIVERQVLLMQRAELASHTDPQIRAGVENRQQADQAALRRFKARSAKRNGVRDANGRLQAGALRRAMRRFDTIEFAASSLRRAGGAVRVMLMVTNVLEGALAGVQQDVTLWMSDRIFDYMNEGVAKDYAFTDELRTMSESKEAVEARTIAESLYNAGGLDMLRAFLTELGDDGRLKYKLTKEDFGRFMYDYGYTDTGPLSDAMRKLLKVTPDKEAGVRYQLRNVMDSLNDLLLGGSDMFKTTESRRFVRMSMSEMARSSVHGRESYNSQQVTDWGYGGTGGEGLIRQLLQTDAGLEAFMTQGITSLGKKSPAQNRMRVVLGKMGVIDMAVRAMLGKFVEYGRAKISRLMPMSNTIGYLQSYGVKHMGDFLAVASEGHPMMGTPNFANAMQRNWDYRVGSRLEFKEGLRKNFMYDMVMAGTELGKALVVWGIVKFLGGIFLPKDDEEENRYTFSEWTIGDGENALPIRFAWFTDDLAGVGVPLGLALAMCEQYGWSEMLPTAAICFENQIANFNDGNAILQAIDLVNDPQKHIEAFLGTDVSGYDPTFEERANAFLANGLWRILGDMTPAVLGEIIPWSRDYIFRGDVTETTPYKMYDEDGRVVDVDDYAEIMRRTGSASNWLQAAFYDALRDSTTSYKYANMPTSTYSDPLTVRLYSDFYLDVDNLPLNQDERMAMLNAEADAVIQWIDSHYENADQATTQGFALNYEAKRNCRRYCFYMAGQIEAELEAKKHEVGHLSDEEWHSYQDRKQHYYDLASGFFPDKGGVYTGVPKYDRLETDFETRYVDDEGKAAAWHDTLSFLGGQAHAEDYRYGNVPSILPWSSPRSNETTGYNYETIPYWVRLGEDGRPINDVGAMFDLAGQMGPITLGSDIGKDVQELMWGGQGSNMYDGTKEELDIPREGIPTVGRRALVPDEETVPDAIRNMSDAELFGIPEDEGAEADAAKAVAGEATDQYLYGGASYGRRYSYYPRSYMYGGGGGGTYSSSSYSAYNPKIYSTSKQVQSDRAASLSPRQPYKATTTYLRPGFYTKGSREAYRRSDI